MTDALPDGAPIAAEPCISNPSFEGTPAFNVLDNFDAPPWTSCVVQGADIWNAAQAIPGEGLEAAGGQTYLRMYSSTVDRHESVSQPMCVPLRGGARYGLALDVAMRPQYENEAPARLEIWGANVQCGEEVLLWTSPAPGPEWRTVCATFTPPRDFTHLTLKPSAAETYPGVIWVDHLVPASQCE